MTSRRRRLDTEMVRRGIVASRAQAQRLIDDHRVTVSGSLAVKASRLVHPAEPLILTEEPPRYVSRGGSKLEAALAGFGIDPRGCRAIDIGASTGGFTDCLLQHGASHVVAIDVGRNQLHERLRADPRVMALEGLDVRNTNIDSIGGPAPLVTVDVSFISLRLVIQQVCRMAGADIVALVKPQFEAGKAAADRGRGVIRDPEVWRQVLVATTGAATGAAAAIIAIMVSPITGAQGNVEFLLHARSSSGMAQASNLAGTIDSAVADAEHLLD